MPSIDQRSDTQLIDAIEDGDSQAFATLYYRYRDWVISLAYRLTSNHDDALDVLQETFSYLLRKFPGLQLRSSFTTFLYPVVRNLSITARRKRGRFANDEEALASVAAFQLDSGGNLANADLLAALSCLSEPLRQTLLRRYLDGLTLEEIAVASDIPVGTVKSRLHNALQTLRSDPRAQRFFQAE